MSRSDRFQENKSRHELPTFRRPNYRELISNDHSEIHLSRKKIEAILRLWTQGDEDGDADSYYRQVTEALLSDDYDKIEDLKDFIRKLLYAIRECDQETYTGKLYRGVSLDPSVVEREYIVNSTVLFPGITSTTKSKRIARGFSETNITNDDQEPYIFVIDMCEARGVTYFADISPYSHFPDEQEVLFFAYSGFKITAVNTETRQINLSPVDTKIVESMNRILIPKSFKFQHSEDSNRRLKITRKAGKINGHYTKQDKNYEETKGKGYWDSPYRFYFQNAQRDKTIGYIRHERDFVDAADASSEEDETSDSDEESSDDDDETDEESIVGQGECDDWDEYDKNNSFKRTWHVRSVKH